MLEKIRQAIDAGNLAVAEASNENKGSEKPAIAFLALDALGPTAEDFRRRHLVATKADGARALFILGPKSELEHPDLDLLCEYLPMPEDLVRATGERADGARLYVRTRLRLILDKWAVRECRWVGEAAADLVDGLRDERDGIQRPVNFLPAR